jgi:serine/threonine protein kinase
VRADADHYCEGLLPMTVETLGPCAGFVQELSGHKLIPPAQVRACTELLQGNPRLTPAALADQLVEQGILSRFQADHVLQGNVRSLVVGEYVVQDALGTGSMGTVYKVRGTADNRSYVLKVLPRRNVVNARAAAQRLRTFLEFRHAAINPLVRVGTFGERHYLVWPHLAGAESLEALVSRDGKIAPRQAALFGLQLARGLHACHQAGLFHGVLKPSDVLVDGEGKVRLLDFGIGCLLTLSKAEAVLDTMTTMNQRARALDCSSPESCLDATQRTAAGDQYSLGCLLYFCLVGRFPFAGKNYTAKLMAHQFQEPAPIRDASPEVTEGLVAIIHRLMRKAPEERFPSMQQAVDALRNLFSRPGEKQAPAAVPEEPSEPPAPAAPAEEAAATEPADPEPAEHSGLAPLLLAALFFGALLGGLGWFLFR